MYHLTLSLTGVEQYLDGARRYDVNSHYLVNSKEDGESICKYLSTSNTISYTLESCKSVNFEEIKRLLSCHKKAIKLKLYSLSKYSPSEIRALLNEAKDNILPDGSLLLRMVECNGVEFHHLHDSYLLEPLSSRAIQSVSNLIERYLPRAQYHLADILKHIKSIEGKRVVWGEVIKYISELIEKIINGNHVKLTSIEKRELQDTGRLLGKNIEGILASSKMVNDSETLINPNYTKEV